MLELRKGKTLEEQKRLTAAACALARCADGVPPTDPYYVALKAMQSEGEQYAHEQSLLKATGKFKDYGVADSLKDGYSSADPFVEKIRGVGNMATGSLLAGGSTTAAIAACKGSAGALCEPAATGAIFGIKAGWDTGKRGYDQLTGPYEHHLGQQVLNSLDVPTQDSSRLGQDMLHVGTWVAGMYLGNKLMGPGTASKKPPVVTPGKGTVPAPVPKPANPALNANAAGFNAATINPKDIAEMANKGIKYTADELLATGRTSTGQIVFLENGNNYAGLRHILSRHGDDFAKIGVDESQIPSVIMTAVTKGKVVGYQGAAPGRPIYEITINGSVHRIAVTTGSNGFIVGANPAGRLK